MPGPDRRPEPSSAAQAKIERFQALHDKDPDNPLHLFALGQACLAAEDHERAAATFATCLERDPEWMMAAIRRGRCLVQLGRFEEARASLELVTAWYHSARTGSVETCPLAADHPARTSWLPEVSS